MCWSLFLMLDIFSTKQNPQLCKVNDDAVIFFLIYLQSDILSLFFITFSLKFTTEILRSSGLLFPFHVVYISLCFNFMLCCFWSCQSHVVWISLFQSHVLLCVLVAIHSSISLNLMTSSRHLRNIRQTSQFEINPGQPGGVLGCISWYWRCFPMKTTHCD